MGAHRIGERDARGQVGQVGLRAVLVGRAIARTRLSNDVATLAELPDRALLALSSVFTPIAPLCLPARAVGDRAGGCAVLGSTAGVQVAIGRRLRQLERCGAQQRADLDMVQKLREPLFGGGPRSNGTEN